MHVLVPPMTDVAFDLAAESLPAGYAWPLAEAIERALPWLVGEAGAGMHPLRVMPTAYGMVLLAQRAKLVLRVPAGRFEASRALEGLALDIGGSRLEVGAGRPRTLRASATLAAQRVASAAADARAFEDEARARLDALGVEGALIAGRPREERSGGQRVAGYALTLHGLSAAASLRVQAAGLGGERRLGWGVFVPAKTIDGIEETAA